MMLISLKSCKFKWTSSSSVNGFHSWCDAFYCHSFIHFGIFSKEFHLRRMTPSKGMLSDGISWTNKHSFIAFFTIFLHFLLLFFCNWWAYGFEYEAVMKCVNTTNWTICEVHLSLFLFCSSSSSEIEMMMSFSTSKYVCWRRMNKKPRLSTNWHKEEIWKNCNEFLKENWKEKRFICGCGVCVCCVWVFFVFILIFFTWISLAKNEENIFNVHKWSDLAI